MVKLLVSKEASHCVGVLDRRSIWAYAFVLLTGPGITAEPHTLPELGGCITWIPVQHVLRNPQTVVCERLLGSHKS